MNLFTFYIPTDRFGLLTVDAYVSRDEYEVHTILNDEGQHVRCDVDLLEEIELAIEAEYAARTYETDYFDCDDARLYAVHYGRYRAA